MERLQGKAKKKEKVGELEDEVEKTPKRLQ